MLKRAKSAWFKLKNYRKRMHALIQENANLRQELEKIEQCLDETGVAFSELDTARNVKMSIDALKWENEQLRNELCYYKRKYGDAWESSTQ